MRGADGTVIVEEEALYAPAPEINLVLVIYPAKVSEPLLFAPCMIDVLVVGFVIAAVVVATLVPFINNDKLLDVSEATAT